MTRHQIIVSSMLAVMAVLALHHVSTFPVAGQTDVEQAGQAHPPRTAPEIDADAPSKPAYGDNIRSLT